MTTKPSKELQAEWDKKLKESGFEDIENGLGHLKLWSRSFGVHHPDSARVEAAQEYYSMAGKFLHDYEFTSEMQKTIWEYHANGLSIRDIVKVLGKAKIINPSTGTPYSRMRVFRIVRSLEDSMKRMYLIGYGSETPT